MTEFIVAKKTEANQWMGVGGYIGEGETPTDAALDAIKKAGVEHPDSDAFIASPSEHVVYGTVTREYVAHVTEQPPEDIVRTAQPVGDPEPVNP